MWWHSESASLQVGLGSPHPPGGHSNYRPPGPGGPPAFPGSSGGPGQPSRPPAQQAPQVKISQSNMGCTGTRLITNQSMNVCFIKRKETRKWMCNDQETSYLYIPNAAVGAIIGKIKIQQVRLIVVLTHLPSFSSLFLIVVVVVNNAKCNYLVMTAKKV